MEIVAGTPDRSISRGGVIRVRDGIGRRIGDRLAGEEPLAIRISGPGQDPIDVAVTMRTPGYETELAVGFLHTEGLLDRDDLDEVVFADPAVVARPEDEVLVRVRRHVDEDEIATRHFVATASCGICGKAALDDVAVRADRLSEGPAIQASVLTRLPGALREAQSAFESTGGLHASGLFTPEGELVVVREDVGRHNALDKVIGERFLARALRGQEMVLLLSGRVSFELVQKAAVAGIPIVAAIGAPSDLAVEAADRVGMTLVGFVRANGFNVYTHPARVEGIAT